jgi:methionyl-tRNA formyltransferase
MMRAVFFGSPDYALPSLRALLAAPAVELVAVVTQPDRPRGRSGAAHPTPVAALAATVGVRTLKPTRIDRAITAAIAALAPNVAVLAASGHILPQHLLDAFPRGVLNVHASLLPRHRGASPVAAAILAGDAHAGASIMLVVRELDAGPVLGTAATPIDPLDTTGTLTARIAELGASLLLELLPRWVAGDLSAQPQDPALASYAPRLGKADGRLDWSEPAVTLWRRVRAYHPWPLATTSYHGDQLAIHAAWPLDRDLGAAPGSVVAGDGATVAPELGAARALALVACGPPGAPSALALLRVQRAGRRSLDIADYLRGDSALIGARLGDGDPGAHG